MFERQVYWTDSTKQGVIRVDKFNGTDTMKQIYNNSDNVKNPKAIRAVHELLQRKGGLRAKLNQRLRGDRPGDLNLRVASLSHS